MNIHTVRAPFMSRRSQFTEGKQTLCIGLDMVALKSTDKYRCFLGKNKKTYYEIETSLAIDFAVSANSIWKNRDGRKVAILPIFLFKVVHPEPSPNEYSTKNLQVALFEENGQGKKGGEKI